ncbi:MAG: hypothetical protein ACYC9L_16040 [Sulfuricaulis sp.]
MATNNTTTASLTSLTNDQCSEIKADNRGHEFNFTMSGSLYKLAEGVGKMDVYEQLSMRLSQLYAMLTMTVGAGTESFNLWSDDIRESYMSACAMIAAECKELADLMV